ncbi:MAG: bacterioferritin-associated ferredoxin [Burkholderiaceae bacterium]
MIVCVCNAISDSEIKEWVALGGDSLEQLESDLGLGTCCGQCRDCAQDLVSSEVAMNTIQVSRS